MGLFDDIQSSLNRGVAGANRGVETLRLKTQLSDALKRRQQLTAQLGASLYDATKDNPTFRMDREALYDGIAQIDVEREEIQARLDEIDLQAAQAAEAAHASATLECPFCHARISAGDMFCSACGKPMAEIQNELAAQGHVGDEHNNEGPQSGGPVCPSCGAPVNEGDAFCMSCGTKLS